MYLATSLFIYSFFIVCLQAQEISHLISCQPVALKAVRLQALVPPYSEMKDKGDTLDKFDVSSLKTCYVFPIYFILAFKVRLIFKPCDWVWKNIADEMKLWSGSGKNSAGSFSATVRCFRFIKLFAVEWNMKISIQCVANYLLHFYHFQRERVEALLEDSKGLIVNRISWEMKYR